MTMLEIMEAHEANPGASKCFINPADSKDICLRLAGLPILPKGLDAQGNIALTFESDETQPVGTLRFE